MVDIFVPGVCGRCGLKKERYVEFRELGEGDVIEEVGEVGRGWRRVELWLCGGCDGVAVDRLLRRGVV